jgi:hypothetical protein
MSRTKLSRRTVLRGLLGGAAVSVGLPMLNVFLNDNGDALADGTAFPRRFGLFFWGNGMIPERWVPAQSGVDYELSEQLAPLAPVKDDLLVVTGTDCLIPNAIPHEAGPAGILSAAPLIVNGEESTFSQPSIDQVLAQSVGNLTRFRSIEAGVQPGVVGRSFTGPNAQNPPETSPFALYQRLFGPDFVEPGDEPIIDPKLALRRSVLDAVMSDSNKLKARVGAADKIRLEQHFDGIRDLEQRLQRLEEDPPNLASCERPEQPPLSFPPIDGRPDLQSINIAMSELLAMALACDQTRVVSLWFSEPVNNTLFPGASKGHHQLTHDEGGLQPEVHAIVLQIMEAYKEFLLRLRAIPEGDETLLDHCAVLGTSDVSFGRQHLITDHPVLIGGSCCGYFKTGQHYRSIGENASKVVLSLLRSQGMSLAEYGQDDGHVTDSLGAIEA